MTESAEHIRDVAGRKEDGLSQEEAAARLSAEGPNELQGPRRRTLPGITLDVLREPMFALLIGAAVLYGSIGDLAEALILFAFASASVAIAVVQRGRSERVLESLRELSSPRALVLRGGERVRIAAAEVVRGDLLLIGEGDRITADAELMAAQDLSVDESLLTGESVAVPKHAVDDVPAQGSNASRVYRGCLVVRGSGAARVLATGRHTALGMIGQQVSSIDHETPRLQMQTRSIVLWAAVGGIALSLAATILHGLLRGNWIEAVLGGLALSMALLPEEFPLVLSVFMVMGARRLSRFQVLTRRAAAIETLGAATVLCTDKTGTLTCNQMSVQRLVTSQASWAAGAPAAEIGVSQRLAELLRVAALACDRHSHDPMDRAVLQLADETGCLRALPDIEQQLRVYGLRRELLAVTHVWRGAATACECASKGAPEAIVELCRMPPEQAAALHDAASELAREGIRVLAVATGQCDAAALPEQPSELPMRFLGLLGFADPLRPSIGDAMHECRSAGIRVVMITGDYPETARAIARQAGLTAGDLLTGAEVDLASDIELRRELRTTTVFARTTPAQKLRIVQALKANGEVVAMTGDGVNDAPALKAAHIGVAMGKRGTDVAREAAALVLLDDDFGSIVRAVREGRRIYDNLQKAMSFIVAVHIPIAGVAFLPLVLGEPLLLTPLFIALLELLIDPACSIVLEAEPGERNIMARPPRDPGASLLSVALLRWGLVQGMIASGVLFLLYWSTRGAVGDAQSERTVMFVGIVTCNLALVLVNRGFDNSVRHVLSRGTPALYAGMVLVCSMLGVMLGWPAARELLALGNPEPTDLLAATVSGGLLLVLLQRCKGLFLPSSGKY